MILRLLNWQGIAGIAIALGLGLLLAIQKGETTHWKKQSAGIERLYRQEQAAFAGTLANYRGAAEQARSADQVNAARVAAEQRAINDRSKHDFETRLAAARAAAQRLRLATEGAADPGARANASMPGVPAAARDAAEGAGKDRLSRSDRLIATEQAIQLDELIKWIKAQSKVDPNVGH